MRIIGEPSCTVAAFDQSESEIGKVILDFNAKFILPGRDSQPTVTFHRIFTSPPDTLASFAKYEDESARAIVTYLLDLLRVPTPDKIVDPVLTALVIIVSRQIDWSLGLKATVTVDITVATLPPPPSYRLAEVVHVRFDFGGDGEPFSDEDFDDDDDLDREIRGLERVRVSTAGMECKVCMEDLTVGTEATLLPCSHAFHGDCVVEWLGTNNFCPICRF